MRIALVGLFVDDQEKARKFYTEAVGLQVKTDASYGPEGRWIPVVSAAGPAGVEVVLPCGDDAPRASQQAAKAAGRPLISLSSDDAQRDYERLRANGVEFMMPDRKSVV